MCQDHDKPVKSKSHPQMRRSAIFQRFNKEPELILYLFICQLKQPENLLLDFKIVNTL